MADKVSADMLLLQIRKKINSAKRTTGFGYTKQIASSLTGQDFSQNPDEAAQWTKANLPKMSEQQLQAVAHILGIPTEVNPKFKEFDPTAPQYTKPVMATTGNTTDQIVRAVRHLYRNTNDVSLGASSTKDTIPGAKSRTQSNAFTNLYQLGKGLADSLSVNSGRGAFNAPVGKAFLDTLGKNAVPSPVPAPEPVTSPVADLVDQGISPELAQQHTDDSERLVAIEQIKADAKAQGLNPADFLDDDNINEAINQLRKPKISITESKR